MIKLVFMVLLVSAGVTVDWLALLIGWWWITPVVGLLIGLCKHSTFVGFLLTLCVGCLGWGLPLAVLAISAPVKGIASAVEDVIALSSTNGVAIILATLLLGGLLSVVGTYVGVTGRSLSGALWSKKV
jgi:hypothetical protein